MQVPERLALIGGSILLASTLIFTLKSQASTLLPKVEHPISSVFDDISNEQNGNFDHDFHNAQKMGWKTGHWGTAPYYIDATSNDMYVGRGELQTGNTLRNTLGDGETDALHSLNIVQPVQAPTDSSNLFSTSNGIADNGSSLKQINGLENVDTSAVTRMYNMFTNDYKLEHINGIKNWNTSQVKDMTWAFNNNSSLQNINVANWNVSNVQDMGFMFDHDSSLTHLDLSGWNNSNTSKMTHMLGNEDSLKSLTLSNEMHFNSSAGVNGGNWSNNGQTLNDTRMQDGQNHPGTWIWVSE